MISKNPKFGNFYTKRHGANFDVQLQDIDPAVVPLLSLEGMYITVTPNDVVINDHSYEMALAMARARRPGMYSGVISSTGSKFGTVKFESAGHLRVKRAAFPNLMVP